MAEQITLDMIDRPAPREIGPGDIDDAFGRPVVDDTPIRDFFRSAFEAAQTAPEAIGVPQTVPPEAISLDRAFQAGFQHSITGLIKRGKLPDIGIPEDPPMAERIASQIGTLSGDLPAMWAGYWMAGGQVTGLGGAFALPAALREVLMQQYANGKIDSFSRFWEVASSAFIEELKGFTTGVATGGVGKAVGAVGASAAVKFASEITTMVGVGAALDGRVPEPEEFVDTAIVLGGFKASRMTNAKLRNVYARTGIRPEEVFRDAASEKTVVEDLASTNIEIPRAYRALIEPSTRADAEVAKVREQARQVAPEALEGIETLNTPEGRVLSRLSLDEASPRASSQSHFDSFYQTWVDKLNPIQRAVEAMAEGKPIEAIADAYKLARMRVSSSRKADHFLRYGTFDPQGRLVGEPLQAILRPNAERLDSLRAYLASRRSLELASREIETGIDTTDARAVVDAGRAEFEPIAERLDTYQETTLRYFQKSGMLSEEQVDVMRESNRAYVPFFRVFEDAPGGGPTPGKPPSVYQLIRRIRGSEAKIVDPLESIVKNTYAMIEMAERNRVHRAYVELAETSGLGGEYANKVKKTTRPVKLSKEERKALVDRVLRGEELTGAQEAALEQDFAIFRPNPTTAGKNEIVVYRDGVREVWSVQPEVFESFGSLDSTSAGIVMRILSVPARTLRAGSVLSPDFMARNPVRDQFTAFLYSTANLKPFLDLARGITHVVKRDAVYQEWLRSGGPMAALQSLDRSYLQENIRGLIEQTNMFNAARNVVRHPVDTLRMIAEVGEEATRVGEFKRVRAKGGSLEEAGFASREVTLDFNRAGLQGQQINQIIAFWNAQVQGTDKMVRAFKDNPAQMAARVGISITLPSVVLYLMNKDEPAYKRLPQWQRDLFWIAIVGDGDDKTVWRIPKPFEVGIIFGTGAERMTQAILDLDPKAFDNFLETLWRGLSPGIAPTLGVPIAEEIFNRSIFLDRPLVPASREKMLPEYQYQPYTTELTKAIGHAIASVPGFKRSTKASPAVIDNYVRGWTGGLGVYVQQLANKTLTEAGLLPERIDPTPTWADTPFFKAFAVRYPSAGMDSIQKFYERFAEEESLIYTIRQLQKEGEPEAALLEFKIAGEQIVDLTEMRDAISGMGAFTRSIYRDPSMSADQKRQITDEFYFMMADIADAGLEALDRVEEIRKQSRQEANP